MPRWRWRGALPRNLSRGMPRSWCSDGMVTKPPPKERTISCAWCNDHGPPESTIPIFGIPSCALRSASTRRPPERNLPNTIKRTELVLAGRSKAQMFEGIKVAFDEKELPVLESGAMCFMMSKQSYLSDRDPHWHPHLMFFVPLMDPAAWGTGLPGSPVILGVEDTPDRMTVFWIPVAKWSDGTAAP